VKQDFREQVLMRWINITIVALASASLISSCSPSDRGTTTPVDRPAPSNSDTAARFAAQAEAIAKQKADDKAKQEAALRQASERYQGALPFGESGQAETIDLFMDVCVDRFTKDLNATFQIAKDSGYEVILERSDIVHYREADEEIPVIKAWTRSPASGQDGTACPIRLDVDFSSYGASCKVRLDTPCAYFDPVGSFLEKNFLQNEYVTLSEVTAEQDRLAAADPQENDCSGTTTSASDFKKRRFEINHPTSDVTSASLEYTRCKNQNVTLVAFIPWIEN